jgi:hypothetical protein
VYEHLQEVIQGGAAPVARNPDEVVSFVARYLEDPSLDREKRLYSAQRELGPMDGRSGERTACYLLELIGVPKPSSRATSTPAAEQVSA